MYTGYGPEQIPSTRYRDLVDLVLIVTTGSLDAEPTIQSLQSEARRRNLVLPPRLHTPGPQWHVGYTTIARDSSVSADLRNLDIALETVGWCINPLLSGAVRRGLLTPATLIGPNAERDLCQANSHPARSIGLVRPDRYATCGGAVVRPDKSGFSISR